MSQPQTPVPRTKEFYINTPPSEKAKRREAFLSAFWQTYGLHNSPTKPTSPFPVERLRDEQFPYVKHNVYLDHTGTTIPSQYQVRKSAEVISNSLFGNPHSNHTASVRAGKQVQNLKKTALSFFNTDSTKYTPILVLNASHALEKIGNTFPWTKNSNFIYTIHNHNSVVGIREIAAQHKSTSKRLNDVSVFQEDIPISPESPHSPKAESLFAFPAECNFSGLKYNLNFISEIQKGNIELCKKLDIPCVPYRVLLDASAYVSTNPLDLTRYSPDYVCLSFYKMLGYPTGMGLLLLKNTMKHILRYPKYFAGGTVLVVGEDSWVPYPEPSHRLEYGTQAFHTATEVAIGLNWLRNLPKYLKVDVSTMHSFNPAMLLIQRHVASLSRYLLFALTQLKHSTGKPLAAVFGDQISESTGLTRHSAKHQAFGGIVSFQCIGPQGNPTGRVMIDKLLSLEHVQIRSGAFCNFGANALYLSIGDDDALTSLKVYVYEPSIKTLCDNLNFVGSGKPFGALRVSLGYMTTFDDIDNFLQLFRNIFQDYDSRPFKPIPRNYLSGKPIGNIESIEVFPISGCHGFQPKNWEFVGASLKGNRHWKIVDAEGQEILPDTQPNLFRISASIVYTSDDLSSYTLTVHTSDTENATQIAKEFVFQGDDDGDDNLAIENIHLGGKKKTTLKSSGCGDSSCTPPKSPRLKSPRIFSRKSTDNKTNGNLSPSEPRPRRLSFGRKSSDRPSAADLSSSTDNKGNLSPSEPRPRRLSFGRKSSDRPSTTTENTTTTTDSCCSTPKSILTKSGKPRETLVITKTDEKPVLSSAPLSDILYSEQINAFFSKALGIPCSLVRVVDPSKFPDTIVLPTSSAKHLIYRVPDGPEFIHNVNHDLFRANIIIDDPESSPFQEDYWSSIVFKNPDADPTQDTKLTLECTRAYNQTHLICFDNDGIQNDTPMNCLKEFRQFEDEIHFGIQVSSTCASTLASKCTISVGDCVCPLYRS